MIQVDLPAPRKPVKTVIGISALINLVHCPSCVYAALPIYFLTESDDDDDTEDRRKNGKTKRAAEER